jgi:hypothetical protein
VTNPDATPPSPLGLQSRLSALIVVANPAGIEGHSDGLAQLTPVDEAAEVARAKGALPDMTVRVLGEQGRRATVAEIVEALRRNPADVLYLVCHGMLDEEGPVLLLENERGAVARVRGHALAARIRDLGPEVPTLSVLVSCQSAGPDPDGFAINDADVAEARARSTASLTAFGPELSRAGSVVVIAMQGNVSMDTAARFGARVQVAKRGLLFRPGQTNFTSIISAMIRLKISIRKRSGRSRAVTFAGRSRICGARPGPTT